MMARRPSGPARIIITTNPLNHEGGVVNYYRIFLSRFGDSRFELLHHSFGSRMELFYSKVLKAILYPLFFLLDALRLLWMLASDRSVRIVQVSPSLIPVPLLRDGMVLLIAKLFRRKVIVFYRGWKEYFVEWLRRHRLVCAFYRWVFGSADSVVVLARRFEEDLASLGFDTSDVRVSSTMFEGDRIIRPEQLSNDPVVRFLFLGRVSHLKGIHELVEAAALLSRDRPNFRIRVVGHADKSGVLEKVQSRIAELGIGDHFEFPGRLTGEAKFQAYADADIYVFPSWQEGCPTSVLEALGSGLFVVATDVGALREILVDGENGRIVRQKDPEDLAEKMRWAVDNIDSIRSRRDHVSKDAFSRYETGRIFDQFSGIYEELLARP